MGFQKSNKRNRLYPTGKDHPTWKGGERSKICKECGKVFEIGNRPITSFKNRKFCSKACADKGGFRYSGKDHPNYREDARRKNRGGSHHKWVNAIVSRDKATCQHCGATGVELHAHHIKSYKDFPDLRFDVDNGITLCFKCHWNLHAALNEKTVNSVDPRPDNAEGNTEPSLRGNVLEGVTTRGRASRRWVGQCSWCNAVISKRLSDTKGKAALFCNGSCRSKWIRKKTHAKAVTSSKSAVRESEDIV